MSAQTRFNSILYKAKVRLAAERMDWQQVVLNGGPPCFHLCEDGAFCGRAERWHDDIATKVCHSFVPLHVLLQRYD